jgi:5-methylcytosine-specific restriction endonuclease McrA
MAVHARDGNKCFYCGGVFPVKELHADHVIAKHAGGSASISNLITACIKCNCHKRDMTVAQFAQYAEGKRLHFEKEFKHWSAVVERFKA